MSAAPDTNNQLLRQMVRFGLVGAVNTICGLGVIYALMYFVQFGPELANVIGYAIGLTVSYWLNKRWTFGSSRLTAEALPRFLLVFAVAYGTCLATVHVTARHFGVNPYLAQILGLMPYTALFFIGSRLYVFPDRSNAVEKRAEQRI